MTKSKVFLLALLSFIGGIFLYSFIKLPPTVIGGSFVLGIFVLIWSCCKQRQGKMKIVGFVLTFCILAFGSGLWRSSSVFDNVSTSFTINKEKIILTGKVVAEPDIRVDFSQYALNITESTVPELKNNGKILVKTGLYPRYNYGDTLKISGKVEVPESRIGGTDFDYKNYLAKDGIFWISRYPEIELLNKSKNHEFYGILFAVKNSFINQINEILPEPQSSFLSALLVGARRSLPESLTEAFVKTGTSHIIAISGYNISLIGAILFNTLGFLLVPRKFIFWITTAVIILFSLIAGAGASVIRAAVMGTLLLVSKREGRFYNMANVIVLAGAAMLFFNPLLLRYDAGFQLSFLATLGLVYLSPYFETLFVKLSNVFSFRSNLAATLSAQLATLPVIIFSFGRLSVFSVPANIMILPAIPPTMFFGFLAATVSFISIKLGSFLGLIAWFLLSYQIWLVRFLSFLS
ncbi:MAG: ComEC/Rec2 family competence protein [bacterium]|nr:ComEC/Rec2 family competence protein [bacterium]